MPTLPIRNEELRAGLARESYPFDANSSLATDSYILGPDVFLDAALYFKTPVELPVHISSVDGTYGTTREALLGIRDASGQEAGTAVLRYDEDVHRVVNSDGVEIGILVTQVAGLRRLMGQTHGRVALFDETVAVFVLDVCKVVATAHLRYVRHAGQALHGNVKLVAGHGVRWTQNQDGSVQLDVVGAPESGTEGLVPLRSLNLVANASMWLAAAPESNLRVDSRSGAIRFVAAGDET